MLGWCAKLIAAATLIVGLETAGSGAVTASAEGESPIRTVVVSLEPGARERFFDELRRYADTHAFAIRIAATRPDEASYLIQMWRSDIKVFGTNPFDRDAFNVSFYWNTAGPIPTQVIHELASRLERELSDVDGISVIETGH